MAVRTRVFLLEQFPAHLNPLHVAVNKLQFTRIFSDCSEITYALLLSCVGTKTPTKAGALVCAHVANEEEIAGCAAGVNTDTLGLYVSNTFLRYYDVQEDTGGTARLLQPLPLSKIVIGARTKQSFKWASSDHFSSVLLILASCHRRTLLARQGDMLLLPYHPLLGDDTAQVYQYLSDLVVLECTPVTQGIITIDTSVVVSDSRDLWQSHGAQECAINRSSNMSLFVSDFAHYANSLSSSNSLFNNKLLANSGFTGFLQALECRLDVRVVDFAKLHRQVKFGLRAGQDAEVDIDSTVFVSKSLLLKLGLFSGEWVISTLAAFVGKAKKSSRTELAQSPITAGHESTSKVTSKARADIRLAKIMVLDVDRFSDMDVGDNVGFISSVHWFNLSNGEPTPVGGKDIRIKRWNKTPLQTGLRLSASACCSAAPSYAKELHVEVVRSPDYISHGPFDNILFKHFSTPRLVQQGYILGIPAQGHPELLQISPDEMTRWPVLYFKVKQVREFSEEEEDEVASYLADTDHTSLYLRGLTNTMAPWSEVGSSFWTSLCPPGLSVPVEQLITIIQPYITDRCAPLTRGCSVLLMGPSGSGKVTVVRAACQRLHLHLLKVDCVSLCGDTAAACESKMAAVFHRAEQHHPCVLLLRNLQLLGQRRDGAEMDSRVVSALHQLIADIHSRVIVVGSVTGQQVLSSNVVPAFVHQVAIESHSEEQRTAILSSLSVDLPLGKDVSLAKIAKQTAGFLLGDFCALLTSAGKAAHRRLFMTYYPHGASVQEEEDMCVCGVTITASDFTTALDTLQKAHSKAIGAPEIPSVRWQDVGGLQQVKKEILDTIQLPLEHPELLSVGLRRSGLLLYGPPGTGKTLLAKAVATECSMTFLSVKGPELINMYVGQSEQNIREVFVKARAAAPCIVFFDELDSLAPNRGHSGDSGGVMDRVVSQLLAELDGLHCSGDVFVIGATNRPDLLDQSLLRPGRFDKLVHVGISEDRESQLQILKAIVRKMKLETGLSLSEVVERCPVRLTGADMYALCSDAMMAAIKRKILCINEGLDSEDGVLTLCAEDFSHALDVLQPSVSEQELQKYKLMQQKFSAK
ncbi:peroxisomal ATPase PEX6 [Brachyhypopomus gauderio]|uniref:peroxisomal ATPase PEX6 n=1 Tax=Brachyhypopomus gauderio TaxID=698409 RepID=UPI004041AC63